MRKEASSPKWHTLEPDKVLARLDSSEEGLSKDQASQRLEKIGANSLKGDEGISKVRLLARQVHNPLIYLLTGAAVLSILVNHRVDAAVIGGVIVLNTLLGFFQEWRAEEALKALRQMAALRAKVLRNGQPVEIDAAHVVPGDVLVLETGDRVAADARLLSGNELQVDESALTGESQPVSKEPAPVTEDTPVADRSNMVWMSTSLTGGRGRAVVVATGMGTQMGRIAGEVRATRREETPLQQRMHRLSLYLGLVGLGLAAAVFGLGLLKKHELVEMLMFSVAVAVSAIPEGLPAVISVTLALGVRRMANRHAIVRRMPAVETLGSITVICSDKTGTITENQMTVRQVWAGGKTFEVSGEGYGPAGDLKTDGETVQELPQALKNLLQIGVLCNNANLEEEDGQWRVEGNPSEGALLVAAGKAGLDFDRWRQERGRLAEVPFSSDTKYMATLHPQEDGAGRVAYVKGAPEQILEFCSQVLEDGQPVELDENLRQEISEVNEDMASRALRVMAGAYREMPQDGDKLEAADVEGGLILAGLWGMIDPPRQESIQAVSDTREAGVRPVMITGDHAVTALAIARKVGIAQDGEALTGRDVDSMDKPALAQAALELGVFARVTPAHKLKIMEALKEQGQVVAMTGDGVNDAPALKGADIGVAMGQAGTEVAKEAADMVLTDDNFATIVHAIEEGRVIYSNLRRVVFFLVATNLGEILTLMGALVIGLDLPLTAVMILWVNLVTDGACTVPLGIEPRHWDVLKRPPRDPKEPIITWRLLLRMGLLTPIMAAGTLGLFWYTLQQNGLDYSRTVAFTTLAAFQWWQAFNARSTYHSVFSVGLFSNRWVLLGVLTAILLQVGAVQTPVGQLAFGTTGLFWKDWLLIVLVSSSIWIADELFKQLGVYGRPPKKTRRRRDDKAAGEKERREALPALTELQQLAEQEQFASVAHELSRLPSEAQAELLENLPEGKAAEVFKFLHPTYQEQAVHNLSEPRALSLVEALDPDDRARLLEQIPDSVAESLLSRLSPAERRLTARLLEYPPESAGRCMTPEFLALKPGLTVNEALAEIRRQAQLVDTVDVLPLVSDDGRFVGVVHLRDLVRSDPDQSLEDLVDHGIEPILAVEDQERAARLIQRTRALAQPVVDDQGRLLGLVTVDDAMDILDRESEEDLARAGGASEPLHRPYFSVSVLRLARTRVVWLLALAIAAVLTVNVLKIFEETLEAVVTLALFIPLLIDTGGNSGAQSATIMVRAMSIGEVKPSDFLRILLREAAVGMLLGIMLAALSLIPLWLFVGKKIALVVALTLVVICGWASAVGAAVPLAARRLGIDPAVASAPFITTLIDATGLIFYFLIARVFLF
jgi:P-type Ca2+ transporter type 2C